MCSAFNTKLAISVSQSGSRSNSTVKINDVAWLANSVGNLELHRRTMYTALARLPLLSFTKAKMSRFLQDTSIETLNESR
jgi:hypothetical protein